MSGRFSHVDSRPDVQACRLRGGRMSKEGKNPRSRDQALNDSTAGQFGEEPRPDIKPDVKKRAPER